MATHASDPAALLDQSGPLSRLLPGYEHRPQQVTMCAEVHSTLEHGGGLAVEAGTGVGKSLAYLLPAALWAARHEQRVVVSTHTRVLQSQLVEKDAPIVAALLGGAVRVAAAYGQENYVCRFRLAASVDRGLFDTLDEARTAEALFEWAEHSEDGLLLAYPGPLSASLAGRIGRDSAACRRDDCPHRRNCHYVAARRSWEQAQVLVVNHALLFSAITGETGLLPEFGALILDEAHRVEEVAARHFGAQASLPGLLQSIDRLAGPRDSLAGRLAPRSPARRAVQTAAASARTATEALAAAIEPLGENGATRSRLHEPVDTAACAQAVENLAEEVEEASGELDDELLAAELDAGGRRLRLAADALRVFAAAPSPDSVRWLEQPDPGRVSLQSAPLSIAGRMREAVYGRVSATVLTSATLTVTGSFDFFADRLGLAGFSTVRLDSPFDYERNCLVYVPAALPRPTAPQFTASAAGALGRILSASRGRALVLFTSYESLNAVHALVPDTGFVHLKQGDEPPPLLLDRFRTDTHSVLFATQSFWQGVDVPGDSLSCLVIVRLPFEVPDDPRLTAICEELKAAGREPFADYQVPTAVLRFRQGFGRLIRSTTDRGAVVVLDRRIIEQPYGRAFLQSLPQGIRLAERFDDFERFFSPAGET